MNTIDFNSITKSIETLRGRWGTFAIATLITWLLLILPMIVLWIIYLPVAAIGAAIFGEGAFLVTLPMFLLGPILVMAAYFPAVAGLLNMCLRTLDGETPSTDHLIEILKRPVPFIIGGVVVGILVGVGSMLCYIPGLIIAGLTLFTVPIMLVEKMAPIDAIKASFDRLKPHWLMATVFYFVITLISQLGVYACGIGLLFTIPVAMMSLAICYRDFHGAGVPEPTPPAN